MSKIEIKENKKLVLKKVVNKRLSNIELQNLDIEINKFYNNIQMLKIQTFGPLIVRNKGVNVSE